MSGLALADAKEWLRYDGSSEDTALGIMLAGGWNWIENYTGYLYPSREVTEPVLPGITYVDLRWRPYEADSLVLAYLDGEYASQVVASVNVFPLNGTYRAAFAAITGAKSITATYTAGYDDIDDIPPVLVQALALYAGMSDEDRVMLSMEGRSSMHFLLQSYRKPVMA